MFIRHQGAAAHEDVQAAASVTSRDTKTWWGKRALGIPTIRDRVVQTAVKIVIEPIFEADLEPNAYGYRPKRSAVDAVSKVHKLLKEGFVNVVDADLSKYFGTIPHTELMQCVARRISECHMLKLIKHWLKVPVQTQDKNGKGRAAGGRGSVAGTPQGGVVHCWPIDT